MTPEDKFKAFREIDSDLFDFEIVRDRIEAGKSFSVEAMEELQSSLFLFVGARIMAAWDRRKEPPSRLVVHVSVEVA